MDNFMSTSSYSPPTRKTEKKRQRMDSDFKYDEAEQTAAPYRESAQGIFNVGREHNNDHNAMNSEGMPNMVRSGTITGAVNVNLNYHSTQGNSHKNHNSSNFFNNSYQGRVHRSSSSPVPMSNRKAARSKQNPFNAYQNENDLSNDSINYGEDPLNPPSAYNSQSVSGATRLFRGDSIDSGSSLGLDAPVTVGTPPNQGNHLNCRGNDFSGQKHSLSQGSSNCDNFMSQATDVMDDSGNNINDYINGTSNAAADDSFDDSDLNTISNFNFQNSTQNMNFSQPEDVSPDDVTKFPPATPAKSFLKIKATSHFENNYGSSCETPRNGIVAAPGTPVAGKGTDTSPSQARFGRFNQDFVIVDTIGSGSFGSVLKCQSRLDGCMYAIKAAKRKWKGASDRERMLKEVYALAALSDVSQSHAFHIVRYHNAWMEDDRLYIQTELCDTSLQKIITSFPEQMKDLNRRYNLLREMLLALELLHKSNLVHLDIKPDNIFIKSGQFKLGDFGLVSMARSQARNDVEEGDSRYMSLELLNDDHSNLTKSDIFSLGATLYEVCLGRPLPCDGVEWQQLRQGQLMLMQETPIEFQNIIASMMSRDPNDRPAAEILLQKRQLMSESERQLQIEKNRVAQLQGAMQQQQILFNKSHVAASNRLQRSSTWDAASAMRRNSDFL